MLLRITDDEPDFTSNIYGTAGISQYSVISIIQTTQTPKKISMAYFGYRDHHSSSSSSSPETSAFSCPALAMSWARSCSSVSETALG